MLSRALSSLRFRLLLLVLVAFVPALALILYMAVEQRQEAASAAQKEALRLAKLSARQHEQMIEATRELLGSLARRPQVRTGDVDGCDDLLEVTLAQYRFYSGLGIVKADGEWLCSTARPDQRPVVFGLPWFERTLTSGDFSIGEYEVTPGTGEATLMLGHPVFDDAGRIDGVAVASLDLAWLGTVVGAAELPPDTVFMVTDRAGTILIRHPDPERWVGRVVTEGPIMAAIREHQDEGVFQAPGLTGVPRLFAFTAIHESPELADVYVSVGMSEQVALQHADRALRRNLMALGAVTLVAALAAGIGGNLAVIRPVRALVEATRRLGRGDLGARLGPPYSPGELGQLNRSFDEMASALEHREAERREVALLAGQNQALELLLDDAPTAEVLDALCALVERQSNQGRCAILLCDARLRTWHRVIAPTLTAEHIRDLEMAGFDTHLNPCAAAVRIKTPIIIPDHSAEQAWPAYRDVADRHGMRATWLMPVLSTDGAALAALMIMHPEPRQPVQHDLRLMELVSHMVRLAIERQEALEAREMSRAELEAANRELDVFAEQAAHDLRNPLGAIEGYADLLSYILPDGDSDTEDHAREALDGILRSTARMNQLIEDLLRLSRTAQKGVEPERCNTRDIVDEVLADLAPQLRQHGTRLFCEPLPTVSADPVLLRQVFENLISNAVKYSRESSSPSVHISCEAVEGEWHFIVRDNGVGFDMSQAARLFHAFERLHDKTYEGTGLGLALVKRIVERHGGRVWAHSTPGQGATFSFSLPAGTVAAAVSQSGTEHEDHRYQALDRKRGVG